MNDEKGKSASLDALRIDRAIKPSRRGPSLLIAALVVVVLTATAGATAYTFWPTSGIPVHIVTAEADAAMSGGAGLDATGYVIARRQATLSAKVLGKLVEVNVEEGKRVEKDQIVARLDDSNVSALLREAKAQERQTKAAFEDAAPIYARYQNLFVQHAISTDALENERSAYDAARTAYDVAQTAVSYAQANENDTIIRAPFAGMVTAKTAQVGDIVAPSAAGGGDTITGLATIVDMDSLEVQVDVSENYIDRVHPGGQATIVLDAYPDWEIPASVIAIIPTADQTKGTVKVRIGIKVKDARILPEMGAHVSFLTGAQPESTYTSHDVSVPPQAVQGSGRTGAVFVVRQDNTVEKRVVTLGLATSQHVMIHSGVSPGDRIVAGDLDKLHDGAKVTIQE